MTEPSPGAAVPPSSHTAPPATPVGQSSHLRRGGALGLILAVVAGALTFGVGLGMRNRVTHHPAHWEPRVLPVVRFVEQANGRPFRHPVTVTFLDDAAFVARLKQDNAPSRQEIAENPWRSASLRALGLAQGKIDLLAAVRSALGGGVYGFYDPKTTEMVIRGDRLTGTVRSTLAHELTHAWQDQWYGLDRSFASSEANAGWNSLVEGHATYVGELYKALVLSAAEQDEAQGVVSDVAGQLDQIPDVVVASISFPYEFGLGYVLSLRDGVPLGSLKPSPATVAAIDRAFANPPASTRSVIEVDGSGPGATVTTPRLQPGERWLDDDMLGAQGLFLAVDERLGYGPARDVVQDWGGDATVFFRRGDTVCFRARVTGRDRAAGVRLRSTLRAWAAKMPSASATALGGRDVMVQSCDPGVGAKLSARPHTLTGSTILAIEQILAVQSRRTGDADRVRAVTGAAVVCAVAGDPKDEQGLVSAAIAVLPKLALQPPGEPFTCPKGA